MDLCQCVNPLHSSPLVLPRIPRILGEPDGMYLVTKLFAEGQELLVSCLPRDLGNEDLGAMCRERHGVWDTRVPSDLALPAWIRFLSYT